VDAHALAVLEYAAIVERLAGAAATPHGASLARALEPSTVVTEVHRRQALTTEAIGLLDLAAEPALGGIDDVRPAVDHATRGGMLGPETLHDVARTITVALAAKHALEELAEQAPLLADLAAPIDPGLATLAETIGRRVEVDGSDLRDSASPKLRRLRSELRAGRPRVIEELRRLAGRSEFREHLQEDFVTERGGRPVLAVRASARGQVRGIVHDASGSGQTLFVEPFAVVELNNRLSEAASAEREEVERILRELSAEVGLSAGALGVLVELTGLLDLVVASGAVSRGWRGAAVESSDDVRLLGARHPLLDPASAVPIDLELGRVRTLVLSGPNTGGKTVALKTLGLAALLHQAGLRPPAVTAALPIFDEVLADIGDEQSIAMSLSTFSGHVSNLVEILGRATDRSLVLIDEIAAGTDPVEGSALAQAILVRLLAQARLTAVTTHYAELKEWASATPGVSNAATGFDPETHAPLYSVALGRPGVSHALRIAERLGLDREVVASARERVSPEQLRIAELLADAELAERRAAETLAGLEQERVEIARLAERARERETVLQAELEAVRASAAQERRRAIADAERELSEARAELGALREDIRVARRREGERRRAGAGSTGRAERDRDRHLGAASERAARAERALRAVEPIDFGAPPAAGDPVEAPELGVRGTIAQIDGNQAEVVGQGGLRVRVPLARLRPDPRGGPATGDPPAVRVVAAARGDVSDELDVRGRRAQDAREAVRTFVDEAALAGLPIVRVVHGRGTGAVRAAVREELNRHQLVERQEADSADGATVVHLSP